MSKLEVINWHDVPVHVTTPDEKLTIPAGAKVFIFANKVAITVTGEDTAADQPAAADGAPDAAQGATP